MSSGAVAIVIASVSAIFTGCNMIASWATYRRARPRVVLSAEFGFSLEESGEHVLLAHMHLRNTGQNPARIAPTGFVTIMRPSPSPRKIRFRPLAPIAEIPTKIGNVLVHGVAGFSSVYDIQGDLEVAGFNGLQWNHSFSLDPAEVPLPNGDGLWIVGARVYLSDGTPVESAWQSFPYAMYVSHSKESLRHSGNQLSFDDLQG
jgi:hypothetical protein